MRPTTSVFSRRSTAIVSGLTAMMLVAAACSSSKKSSTATASSGTTGGSTATSAPSYPPIPAGPIKMAGLYPLSGPYAPFGLTELAAEQAIIAQVNANGGIDGHQIEFTSKNTNLDPALAASEAQQLVSQGVAAILSDGTETEAPADVPIFMKAKVPVVFFNPGDTWADGAKWPYYFMTMWTTDATVKSMVAFAKSKGVKAVGLASDNTGFGQEFTKDATKEAAAIGLPIVKSVSYDPQAVDLSTQMAQLRSAGADSLIIGGGGGFSQSFTALQTMGWSPSIFSYASITKLPKFGGLIGSPLAAKAYVICAGYCIPQGQQVPDALDKLTNAVLAKTGPNPDPGTEIIGANDSLQILKYAIEKTHSLDGDALKKAIEGIQNMGFTLPNYTYTYTSTNHQGLTLMPSMGSVSAGLDSHGFPSVAQ